MKSVMDAFGKWFLLFTALFWLGIVALKSVGGGWHRLASRFRSPADVNGDKFRFASMYIRTGALPVSYINCLFVTVNPTGIRLSILFLYRFLHPPLFVPWSAVERVMPEELGSLTHIAVHLRGLDTSLLFTEPVGTKLVAAFNARYSTIVA